MSSNEMNEARERMIGVLNRVLDPAAYYYPVPSFVKGAIHDVLNYLESERPRVMTLEEVKQMGKKNMEHSDNPYKTCIYERRGNARLCTCSPFWQAPQYEGDENYLNIDYCFIGTDEFDNYPTEYYGQWMRCWTSRPTEEQRDGEPWKMS